jgi:hypothetical protein
VRSCRRVPGCHFVPARLDRGRAVFLDRRRRKPRMSRTTHASILAANGCLLSCLQDVRNGTNEGGDRVNGGVKGTSQVHAGKTKLLMEVPQKCSLWTLGREGKRSSRSRRRSGGGRDRWSRPLPCSLAEVADDGALAQPRNSESSEGEIVSAWYESTMNGRRIPGYLNRCFGNPRSICFGVVGRCSSARTN